MKIWRKHIKHKGTAGAGISLVFSGHRESLGGWSVVDKEQRVKRRDPRGSRGLPDAYN